MTSNGQEIVKIGPKFSRSEYFVSVYPNLHKVGYTEIEIETTNTAL